MSRTATQTALRTAHDALTKAKNSLIAAYDDVMADHGDRGTAHQIYAIQLTLMGTEATLLELEQREANRDGRRKSHRGT